MKQYTSKDLEFKFCRKKPVVVSCAQVNEPFQVQAIEGLLTGKAGDYVMRGVEGELYICAQAIFERTYDMV